MARALLWSESMVDLSDNTSAQAREARRKRAKTRRSFMASFLINSVREHFNNTDNVTRIVVHTSKRMTASRRATA